MQIVPNQDFNGTACQYRTFSYRSRKQWAVPVRYGSLKDEAYSSLIEALNARWAVDWYGTVVSVTLNSKQLTRLLFTCRPNYLCIAFPIVP